MCNINISFILQYTQVYNNYTKKPKESHKNKPTFISQISWGNVFSPNADMFSYVEGKSRQHKYHTILIAAIYWNWRRQWQKRPSDII